jgi:hypothetical protein
VRTITAIHARAAATQPTVAMTSTLDDNAVPSSCALSDVSTRITNTAMISRNVPRITAPVRERRSSRWPVPGATVAAAVAASAIPNVFPCPRSGACSAASSPGWAARVYGFSGSGRRRAGLRVTEARGGGSVPLRVVGGSGSSRRSWRGGAGGRDVGRAVVTAARAAARDMGGVVFGRPWGVVGGTGRVAGSASRGRGGRRTGIARVALSTGSTGRRGGCGLRDGGTARWPRSERRAAAGGGCWRCCRGGSGGGCCRGGCWRDVPWRGACRGGGVTRSWPGVRRLSSVMRTPSGGRAGTARDEICRSLLRVIAATLAHLVRVGIPGGSPRPSPVSAVGEGRRCHPWRRYGSVRRCGGTGTRVRPHRTPGGGHWCRGTARTRPSDGGRRGAGRGQRHAARR